MDSHLGLALERNRYRLGSAIVRLADLKVDEGPEQPPILATTVNKLVSIFELEGCRRQDPENFIPVIINRDALDDALRQSELTRQDLLNPVAIPRLDLSAGYALVIQGRSRLRAAHKYLKPGDQWWIVDFYDSRRCYECCIGFVTYSCTDLPLELRKGLADQVLHEEALSDGEIFRRFRTAPDDAERDRWRARLSPAKRRDVQQLLKNQFSLPLLAGFDSLLPFRGLWQDVELGTLHRILTLRCPQVCEVTPGSQVLLRIIRK